MHFVIVTWNLKSIIKCTEYKTLLIYQFIIGSVSSLSSSKCGQETKVRIGNFDNFFRN